MAAELNELTRKIRDMRPDQRFIKLDSGDVFYVYFDEKRQTPGIAKVVIKGDSNAQA